MATLIKNNGVFENSDVGKMGVWIDSKTGLGYSGPKKNPTDKTANTSTSLNTSSLTRPVPIVPTVPSQSNIQQNAQLQQEQDAPESSQTQQYSPMDKFNMAILDMLKSAQGSSGNEDLYKRQRELQRKQISSGIDYSGTEGMSPNAQENIASARAGEYSTEIDAIGAKIKANDSRLQNFESILGTMRQIGNDIKVKPSEDILKKYVAMIEAGGSLSSVPDEFQQDVIGMTNADTWRKQAQSIAKQKQAESTNQGPSSYQEWNLAGGLEGTGKTYAQWMSGDTNTPSISPYQEERMTRTLENVDALIGKATGWTTGAGSLLGNIPGTAAKDFAAELDTLKANIMFSELTAMREASKTGGALGAISDREGNLLSSALGALDAGQSTQNIIEQLNKIKGSINRWKEAMAVNSRSSLGESLREKVINMGYDYDAMSQRYSDEEISKSIGIPLTKVGNTSASNIANAIKQVESNGNYNAKGASGESGAYQFMPETWINWSKKYLGYIAPMTKENQDIVAKNRIQEWLDLGYNERDIALLWNSGKTTPVKGINSKRVAYDSEAYAQKVLNAIG